jgi:Helicase associated domain
MFQTAWLASRRHVVRSQYLTCMSTKSVQLPYSLAEKPRQLIVPWDVSLQAFAAFVNEHGHGNIKPSMESHRHLYQWIKVQRYRYALKGTGKDTENAAYLTLERIEALNKLGMNWKPLETAWEENFEELKEYISKHGHMKVLKSEDPELLIWIFKQRSSAGGLSQDRREKLNSIDFEWGTSNHDAWMKRYHELEDYVRLYNHTFIPLKDASYFELSLWINKQRSNYGHFKAGRQTSMTEENIKLLDKLGFVWMVQDYMWENKCMELKEFLKKNRSWPSSRSKNQALHCWLSRQLRFSREKRNGGINSLTDEREKKLEAVLGKSITVPI